MPRLGNETDDDNANTRLRRSAIAYPRGNMAPLTILAVLACLLILRNLLFRDYREEMVTHLQSLGQTSEQIERIIPKTIKEHTESRKNEANQLKEDVEYLLAAVHALQVKVGLPTKNETKDDTDG